MLCNKILHLRQNVLTNYLISKVGYYCIKRLKFFTLTFALLLVCLDNRFGVVTRVWTFVQRQDVSVLTLSLP